MHIFKFFYSVLIDINQKNHVKKLNHFDDYFSSQLFDFKKIKLNNLLF